MTADKYGKFLKDFTVIHLHINPTHILNLSLLNVNHLKVTLLCKLTYLITYLFAIHNLKKT